MAARGRVGKADCAPARSGRLVRRVWMRVPLIFLCVCMMLTACGGNDRAPSGAELYAQNCAICHGGDARGGGGGGVEGFGRTPPDLTGLAARNGGVFPAERVAALLEGYAVGGQTLRPMAGFSALQSEERQRVRVDGVRLRMTPPLAKLLAYLNDLQQR